MSEEEHAAASTIQRSARGWLAHHHEGSIIFRKSHHQVLKQAQGPRGLPPWLENVMNDTRRTVAESALAERLDGFVLEFTSQHVAQPQEAQVMHQLCGRQYMERHHPDVGPNPTALGQPYMAEADALELVDELRAALLAHISRRADEAKLVESAEWSAAVEDALPVVKAHYRDDVVLPPVPRNSSVGTRQKRVLRREQLRLELEAVAASLEAVLGRHPEQVERVLDTLQGRQLTPRLRRLLWRSRLATAQHLQAVSRKMELKRGDTGRGQPIPSLLGQMVSTALATSLQLYATSSSRAQRLVEAFGSLYLLREDLSQPALRTALVVTMAMPAEPPVACAAMADAILDAQEAQTSPPILEKAARAILQRVKQMDADLGKHLAQDAWQVLTEHVVLQWCGCAMVGVLQADALLLLWDRCVKDSDWLKAVVYFCVAVLLELREPLLQTTAAAESQDILQSWPAELTTAQVSKRMKSVDPAWAPARASDSASAASALEPSPR